jgi:excisionase family DNA binding protein
MDFSAVYKHSQSTVGAQELITANNDEGSSDAAKRQTDKLTDCHPRLLALKEAAEYLGISYWLIRDWVIDGTLRPVRLPGSRLKKQGRLIANSKDHAMRKIMVDRNDLDQLIEDCKGL